MSHLIALLKRLWRLLTGNKPPKPPLAKASPLKSLNLEVPND